MVYGNLPKNLSGLCGVHVITDVIFVTSILPRKATDSHLRCVEASMRAQQKFRINTFFALALFLSISVFVRVTSITYIISYFIEPFVVLLYKKTTSHDVSRILSPSDLVLKADVMLKHVMLKTMSLHKYIDNILFDCLFYLQNVQAATPVIVKENKSKYLMQVEGQSLMRKPLGKFSVTIQAWFDSY